MQYPGNAHLRHDEQFRPAGCGFRDGVEDLLRVAVDVAARRVELGQGDAHGGCQGCYCIVQGSRFRGSRFGSGSDHAHDKLDQWPAGGPTLQRQRSDCGQGVQRRGSSATRDSPGGSEERVVHERRRAAAPVAVRCQPPDSPPGGRAQRAAVPAPRSQDPHHARRHDAPWPQPADVRRSRADARRHPRHAAERQGHAAARRRHDGLSVRLPAAAQGLSQGASERRRQADAGRDAAA